MVQDSAIFTMADEQKVAYGLSNGAIVAQAVCLLIERL